mmetsp:Transcript_31326/g.105467  ORF Transcript_31326/g.105467 Transcript_31326/m.105467 type:complete len:283 (+) Transcript_31326:661-1509(+)
MRRRLRLRLVRETLPQRPRPDSRYSHRREAAPAPKVDAGPAGPATRERRGPGRVCVRGAVRVRLRREELQEALRVFRVSRGRRLGTRGFARPDANPHLPRFAGFHGFAFETRLVPPVRGAATLRRAFVHGRSSREDGKLAFHEVPRKRAAPDGRRRGRGPSEQAVPEAAESSNGVGPSDFSSTADHGHNRSPRPARFRQTVRRPPTEHARIKAVAPPAPAQRKGVAGGDGEVGERARPQLQRRQVHGTRRRRRPGRLDDRAAGAQARFVRNRRRGRKRPKAV